MEKTLSIPAGVHVDIKGMHVTVKGPKGHLQKDFASPEFGGLVKMENAADKVRISTEETKRKYKSEVGTIVACVNNMMQGVTAPWKYKLKIVYMHFPVTVKMQGREVMISNFLGEKAPRKAEIIGDTKVEIAGDEITVTGINLEEAGQTAANLERATRILARDRRVFMDGIFITEKPK
ncbi:MAG: 50S ribosomal protein L6 [Candidatus Aenigmatarchaeota archaeon]